MCDLKTLFTSGCRDWHRAPSTSHCLASCIARFGPVRHHLLSICSKHPLSKQPSFLSTPLGKCNLRSSHVGAGVLRKFGAEFFLCVCVCFFSCFHLPNKRNVQTGFFSRFLVHRFFAPIFVPIFGAQIFAPIFAQIPQNFGAQIFEPIFAQIFRGFFFDVLALEK